MNRKEIFNQLVDVIEETKYFLKKQSLPIFHLNHEPDPGDIHFPWKALTKKTSEQKAKETKEKQRTNREVINFPCALCTGKVSGIRNFFYRGRKPILVLHYSGAVSPKDKPFVKRSPSQIFREILTEKIWSSLIEKAFGFSYQEFFYQEYPACNFSNVNSKEEDWKTRIDTCKIHIQDNISDFDIQGIILLGSSARLVFGDKAKDFLGKTIHWEFGDKKIPVLTLRSPEALVFLDEKSKSVASEDSVLFQYAQEKQTLETQFLDQLKSISNLIT
ncbi:hypothetical protein [Leptospira sp. 'Mane']|uniref:hypothetical protein n=1 Tax=Leptospira sp. 'Mane' TaxID=3387407 RepID=UPI00398AB17F